MIMIIHVLIYLVINIKIVTKINATSKASENSYVLFHVIVLSFVF